jgi:hypothetical protein
MGAKGGGHAKIELSRHRPAESSKSISRQSAPLAEPSQSPAIRFYERRSRLQARTTQTATADKANRSWIAFLLRICANSCVRDALAFEGGARRSQIHFFTARIWTPASAQKQASEITQTNRQRRSRSGWTRRTLSTGDADVSATNSSITILVLFNGPLEAAQIRVEWFELPFN